MVRIDEADLLAAIDDIESAIGTAMDADPNDQLDGASVSTEFDRFR